MFDDPNTKGDIGEFMVCADLMRKGYVVYRAVNKTARADIIVLSGSGKPYKVQVKTTTGSEGSACLHLRKCCLNPKYNSVYTTDEVDVFALYIENENTVCYISSQEALTNCSTIKFRYELAKNGQKKNVRLVEDYLDFPS